jgi:hypothetical protein
MTRTMESQRHATDGDLIRVIDGELVDADVALGAHVAGCADCSARLNRLRSISSQVSDALRVVDVAPIDPVRIRPPFDDVGVARLRRRRRTVALWSRPGLRAAAALLLLAGVAAASPAARRWIVERVSRLRGTTPAPTAEPRQSSSNQPGSSAGSRVWFAPPTGPELIVRFETRPASGRLVLQAADDDRASAQVVAGASGEALLILPGEVRVRNSAASVADYRLTLPPSVRRVRVHIGPADADPILVDVPPPSTARAVDLTQSPASR